MSKQILKSASAMGSAVFLSRIAGLLREQVFAYFFGAGFAMDAYAIAFRIPNLFRDLFGEGAMSAALVPTFLRVRKEEGDRRAFRVAGLVFRVLFVAVTLLTLVGVAGSTLWVSWFAGAYRQTEGKFELTVHLTQIMFFFFPFVILAAAFMGILNACGKFFVPSVSSAVFNLVSVAVGLTTFGFFQTHGVHAIEGMAYGVVAGGVVQALVQLPLLYRQGYRWQGRLPGDPVWHRDPALRSMLLLLIPGTIGMAATQINVLVNSILATSQGSGAVSWLTYAFRLMQFPIGIFGVSLAQATLPMVSQLRIEGNYQGVGQTLSSSLRRVFAINLPASAGLAFLGVPIIQLIFEYGKFSRYDSEKAALALAAYASGLAFFSIVKVMVPACYALGRTRVAVISSLLSVILNIGFNLLLIGPLGFWGLALGASLAGVFNSGYLILSVQRQLRAQGASLDIGGILKAFATYTGVALAMGAFCQVEMVFLENWIPDGDVQVVGWLVITRLVKTSITVFSGFVLVAAAGHLLGLDEIQEVTRLLLKKLWKAPVASR